jgi:hypothetical protein
MSRVEPPIDVDRLPEPGEQAWQSLCVAAERLVDVDPDRYQAEWLPAARSRLAEWPTRLRRCPDRWFRTPRPRADLLLALGGATPADFDDRSPLRDDPPGEPHLGVSAPGGWTVFTTTDGMEFDMAGDDRGPDPVSLQVAAFVLDNWTDLRGTAERLLNDLAAERGPDDPYLENGAIPPGRPRFESAGMVSIEPVPVRFQLHCEDHRHGHNGWPYGNWRVDFAWGRPVDVRVGTYAYNNSVKGTAARLLRHDY